jgi:hypothetical protein
MFEEALPKSSRCHFQTFREIPSHEFKGKIVQLDLIPRELFELFPGRDEATTFICPLTLAS